MVKGSDWLFSLASVVTGASGMPLDGIWFDKILSIGF
jgi:hypothetical protein